MHNSLVSVICICHNHERFVEEALLSVLHQTYLNIELWVIDNGSTDQSVNVIQKILRSYPSVRFIHHPEGIAYPQAFNQAFGQATGEFVIDLAADDILMPQRIAEGVKAFEIMGPDYGVHFSDGWMIDTNGGNLSLHSDRFPHHQIPEGDVYKNLVERFFILTPSMMMRASLLHQLNGYDKNLSYEDFDFWIRSARISKYVYSPTPLVSKRLVAGSMSSQQYRFRSIHLLSTFRVCEKVFNLNRSHKEDKALKKRIYYEAWQTLKLFRLDLTFRYLILWFRIILRY